ncbi:uncharacterized protein FOKN1_1326 [Thiohalobacter thiocyanaticus]|uniref:Uncharacterized protein n=1 Tax=Thiohalobacter thiocyanaticus TaxID=585455 RepID=A0A1Z4VR94_9GAMM|nr:type I-F CRISPR-associated endoribonuclease Cas6/Csy4 [Thiohalobacter thiocyanaticus]BAZ93724.1 uncharacterized protein FOKN1_1326 [Thiohalobacter thiocyanaticus]
MPSLTHYFDIEARAGTEVSMPVIISTVVQRLHCAGKAGAYALGFPGLKGFSPGGVVRVFSSDTKLLETLQDHIERDGVDDFVKIRRIAEVPEGHGYAVFRSIKAKALPSRANRREKRRESGVGRHGAYSEEELAAIEEKRDRLNALPYLRFTSLSTRSPIRVHIEKVEVDSACDGTPNSYGLASGQPGAERYFSVPDF